jgi:hypothetical protein
LKIEVKTNGETNSHVDTTVENIRECSVFSCAQDLNCSLSATNRFALLSQLQLLPEDQHIIHLVNLIT